MFYLVIMVSTCFFIVAQGDDDRNTMHRRDFIKTTAILAAAPMLFPPGRLTAAPVTVRTIGKPQPFDYARLKGHARALANAAYQPPRNTLPKTLVDLGWDEYQSIHFLPDHALWAKEGARFSCSSSTSAAFFKEPVRMYEVVDGKAQEIAYDPGDVRLRQERPRRNRAARGPRLRRLSGALPHAIGSATSPRFSARAISARWAAIGSTACRRAGWPSIPGGTRRVSALHRLLARRPPPTHPALTVYALLDSPSIAGAYRFDIRPARTW